jgi:hypothetical protein
LCLCGHLFAIFSVSANYFIKFRYLYAVLCLLKLYLLIERDFNLVLYSWCNSRRSKWNEMSWGLFKCKSSIDRSIDWNLYNVCCTFCFIASAVCLREISLFTVNWYFRDLISHFLLVSFRLVLLSPCFKYLFICSN